MIKKLIILWKGFSYKFLHDLPFSLETVTLHYLVDTHCISTKVSSTHFYFSETRPFKLFQKDCVFVICRNMSQLICLLLKMLGKILENLKISFTISIPKFNFRILMINVLTKNKSYQDQVPYKWMLYNCYYDCNI